MSQGESKLSRKIMAELRQRGAFVWKNHGGPTMMNGLPDIAGVYRGFFISIETKMPEGDEPTPIQLLRHAQIREAGGIVLVARSVEDALRVLDVIDWHPIPDYPEYEINPYTHNVRHKRTHKLRNQFMANGSPAVSLKNDNGQRPVRIARILASIFLGPIEPGIVVRHLNDDKQDNELSNLAFGTPRDNVEDAIRNGRTQNFSHKDCDHPGTAKARLHCNRQRQGIV